MLNNVYSLLIALIVGLSIYISISLIALLTSAIVLSSLSLTSIYSFSSFSLALSLPALFLATLTNASYASCC
jgi:hypothetical protein